MYMYTTVHTKEQGDKREGGQKNKVGKNGTGDKKRRKEARNKEEQRRMKTRFRFDGQTTLPVILRAVNGWQRAFNVEGRGMVIDSSPSAVAIPTKQRFV